ncbi:MAG: PulJ/GspJ family protein [Planctomycetota bacterium]|jgi:hypothetical protein
MQSSIVNRQSSIRRGFTLLEAVLAVSLTVILIGSVYAYYHTTLRARDALNDTNDTTLAQRRILEMMAEDLRSAVAFSGLQTSLEGTAEAFTVPRAVVPPPLMFLTEAAGGGELGVADGPAEAGVAFPPQHDVQLVGYRLYRYEDEEGLEQIGGVERTCQRTVMARAAEEGEDIEAVLLSEHVKFLYVTYWSPDEGEEGDWLETWSAALPPKAVRIELGAEPLDEDLTPDEYPHPTMWRVVDIPAGGAVPPSRGRGRGGRSGDRGGTRR